MRAITTDISIAAAPDSILQAFLAQEHLQQWWGVSRSLVEPRPGGCYTLAWEISESGIKYVTSGVIEKIEPHEYLRIHKMVYLNYEKQILGPMELEIKLSKTDERHTHVALVQSGYQYGGDWDWYYDAVVQAWPYTMGLLKKYLETTYS